MMKTINLPSSLTRLIVAIAIKLFRIIFINIFLRKWITNFLNKLLSLKNVEELDSSI